MHLVIVIHFHPLSDKGKKGLHVVSFVHEGWGEASQRKQHGVGGILLGGGVDGASQRKQHGAGRVL